MSAPPNVDALTRVLDRAVVDHFGGVQADAEQVAVVACSVAGHHIAAVSDPVARGVLLARAQWTLRRVVAEVTKAARKGSKPGGT